MRISRKRVNSLGWIWPPMRMSIVLKCICRTSRKWWNSKFDLIYIQSQCQLFNFVIYRFQNQFTIVPILVGSISPEVEATYGAILAPYLADPQNLFVISSDFCHWGKRFSYTYYDEACGPIHRSIEQLDKKVLRKWIALTRNKANEFIGLLIFSGYGYHRDVEPVRLHWLPEKV